MKMLNYADFLYETYGKVNVQKAKIELLQAIAEKRLNREEQHFFENVMLVGFKAQIIEAVDTGNYDRLFEHMQSNEELLESLWSKAKEKANAAMQKVKEVGKKALDTMSDGTKALIKIGGDILKPFKAILGKIAEGIKKAWEIGKAKAAEAVSKATESIRAKIQSIIKDGEKKKSLLEESGNLSKMAGAGVKFLTSGFVEAMAKSGATAAKTEESFGFSTWIEGAMLISAKNLINEGYSLYKIEKEMASFTEDDAKMLVEGGGEGGLKIPFISALMDKLGHTPPFSYFHKLGEKAGEFANNKLDQASYMISKVGGPGPYKFYVVGGLVAAAVGYLTETGAKSAAHVAIHAIEHALHIAIPGLGIVFTIIKYCGIALAVYGVIKAVAGQDKKEGGEEEKKEVENSSKEGKKEEKKEV